MGFDDAVDSMVSGAIANAVGLFSDFTGYVALMVGVIILGTMLSWFLRNR